MVSGKFMSLLSLFMHVCQTLHDVPCTVYSTPLPSVSCCDNTSSVLCCLAVQLQLFAIGVTTKDPNTKPLPKGWADMDNTDQYWHVAIGSGHCTAWHQGQVKQLLWELHDLPSNTFGCCVMKGKLHLYHNGMDMGVVWEELPTNKPLWGFVRLRGGWKVEGYFVIPKGEALMCEVVCGVRLVNQLLCNHVVTSLTLYFT